MQPSNAKKKTPNTPATDAEEWHRHEHVAGSAQVEAQKLVDALGSAQLAKHAVDAAAEPTPAASGSRDEFAKRLGFGSYLEMFESAEPIQDRAGSTWMVTAVGSRTAVWCERDLTATHYKSRDEAVAAIESGSLGTGANPAE
jgi:hypothetical protein